MVQTRTVIWIMLAATSFCEMLMVHNMSIAILSMVNYSNHSDAHPVNALCSNSINISSITGETKYVPLKRIIEGNNIFNWDTLEQNMILGGNNLFTGVSQFLSGLVIHKYGPKRVITIIYISCGVLTCLVPSLAHVSPMYVVWLRVLIGFLLGLGIPSALFALMGKWSPPDERGKFMSCFIAVPLGTAAAFTLFGFIADNFGWSYVFYSTSAIIAIWFVLCIYLVYETPENHPRISNAERDYIAKSLINDITDETLPVPWLHIFTSFPFIICVISHFGFYWSTMTLVMYGPMYFKAYYGFSTEQNGVVSSLPYIARTVLLYISGFLGDLIVRTKFMSVSNNRKLFTIIGMILSGFALLLLTVIDCDVYMAILCLTLFVALSASFTTGPSISVIDMSPNFCYILQGTCGAFATPTGFITALVTNYLSLYNDEYMVWKKVFIIAALMNIIPGFLFLFFGSSEIQPWNYPDMKQKIKFQSIRNNYELDEKQIETPGNSNSTVEITIT